MEMNDDIRKHIMANEDSIAITATARRHGMRTLREDGWDKVEHGVTTPDELLRVTQDF